MPIASHSELAHAPPALAAAPVRLRFDRGTLRLDDVQRGWHSLVATAADVAWDPRTASYRAPPWRHRALIEGMRRLGVAVCDDTARFDAVDERAWSPVPLRPYQGAALGAWEAASRRGVLVLPTGSGKTRIALAAMRMLGCATLCLVPTRALMHQWRREIGRFYTGPVGAWGDGERELRAITVITFESAYRQMPRLGNRFPLVVVDEVHHFGNAMRDEALEMSIAHHRLGLTATPPADEGVLGELERLMGPVVFRTSVGQLAGRYLAAFDTVPIHVRLEADERAAYDAARGAFVPVYAAFCRTAPGAAWKDFIAYANQSREGRAALAAWREARRIIAFPRAKAAVLDALLAEHRTSRVLVFTSDNETAYAIARRNLVMPLTCDIKRAERDECLQRFRTGELSALVSSRVLNEGIDVPDADVGIVVGGTQGIREHVQRVGRLLRPAAGKRATVYELIADDTTEGRDAQRRRQGLGTA